MWCNSLEILYKKGAQGVKAKEASTETLGIHNVWVRYFDDMLTGGNS